MKNKIKYLFGILLVLSLIFTGCSKSGLSKEEVEKNVTNYYKDLSGIESKLNILAGAKNLTLTLEGDLKNKVFHILPVKDNETGKEMEIFYQLSKENIVYYIKTDNNWTKAEQPFGYDLEQYDKNIQNRKSFIPDLKVSGNKYTFGSDYKFSEVLEKAMESMPKDSKNKDFMQQEILLNYLKGFLGNAKFKFIGEIDSSEFYIKNLKLDLTELVEKFNSLSGGKSSNGFENKVNISIDYIKSSEKNITIPKEALDAHMAKPF